MVSQEDQEQLDRAAELLRDVIARHRGEDLRAVAIFTEAITSAPSPIPDLDTLDLN